MKRSNKIVLAALAVLTAAAPLSAFAAPPKPKAHIQKSHEQYASGAITAVSAQELKLSDGQTFKVTPGLAVATYKAGDKVSVRFTTKDGAKTVDQITAAKN
jgi:Cu/Ag efflux protein CusF